MPYPITQVAALVEYGNADDVFVLSKSLNLRVRGSLQSLLAFLVLCNHSSTLRPILNNIQEKH